MDRLWLGVCQELQKLQTTALLLARQFAGDSCTKPKLSRDNRLAEAWTQ